MKAKEIINFTLKKISLTEREIKACREELEAGTEKAYKEFDESRRKAWRDAPYKVLD